MPKLDAALKLTLAALMLVCIASTLLIQVAAAQETEDNDPVLFVIGEGSTYLGGTGWTAGYVISGSGTYTLEISATGPENRFPVSNVKVVVCVTEEATHNATVTIAPNTPSALTITEYTHTDPASPPIYYPPGGVFAEPDYYGYNDTYVIPELTYSETHHSASHYDLQVTVTFGPGTTENSKVLFLCYGTDSKGDPAKTPFSGGTLVVLPEYVAPVAVGALCFAAFGIYRKIHR
jgi:hypothetical protein